MSGLQWKKKGDGHSLKTGRMKITIRHINDKKWFCEVYARNGKHYITDGLHVKVQQLIGFEGIEAKDLEEAKGKAIFAAFDLVIAYAFASREA